jgi:hypothetical protein
MITDALRALDRLEAYIGYTGRDADFNLVRRALNTRADAILNAGVVEPYDAQVERVARAICTAKGSSPDDSTARGGRVWWGYRAEARAAIAAMPSTPSPGVYLAEVKRVLEEIAGLKSSAHFNISRSPEACLARARNLASAALANIGDGGGR